MSYTVTILRPASEATTDRTSSVEVADEAEALRIAQEGTMIAKRRSQYATYEVHDATGRLLASYTSASVDA